MPSKIAMSRDGSWRLEVEVFAVNYFVYKALGVTTRVRRKVSPSWWARLWGATESWDPLRAQVVSAEGRLETSLVPGVAAPIPGSPCTLQNASDADCRAWAVGIGITLVTDKPTSGDPLDLNPSPGGGPSMIADRVTGSGAATYGGETLRVGPLSAA